MKYQLADNQFTEETVENAVQRVLSEDGTIYLVAGYFKPSGYFMIKDAIEGFLDRDEDNRIKVVVGTKVDQFSARIAHDLWNMDEERNNDQIELLKYEGTFLHSKHYLRESDDGNAVILGSANISADAFHSHLELVSYYESDDKDDIIEKHLSWFSQLIEEAEEVTEEDLKKYEEQKVSLEDYDYHDLFEDLDLRLEQFKAALEDPIPYNKYRLNLLGDYLTTEDTAKGSIAVKSKIEKYPHQIIGASKAYKNLRYNGFYLLADEVGLGKTYEAVMAMKQLMFANDVNRVLIVTNSSSMKDWDNVLNNFYEQPTRITPSKRKSLEEQGYSEVGIWEANNILICTPQMFRSRIDDIQEHEWDMLIVDEAHIVKNDETDTHQAVKNFNVPYKLFLTATPVQNRDEELFNIFDALKEGFLGDVRSFNQSGVKRLQEIMKGDRESDYSIVTRFLREDVPYIQIPDRQVEDKLVPLGQQEHEVYAAFYEFLNDMVNRNERGANFVATVYQKIAASSLYALEQSMKRLYAQRTGQDTQQMTLDQLEESMSEDWEEFFGDDDDYKMEIDMDLLEDLIEELESLDDEKKFEVFLDAVRELLQEEDRMVVFTQYLDTMERLASVVEQSDVEVPIYRYFGDLSSSERYEMRDKFEDNGGIFLTTRAGAESINLQHCNLLINFDIPWNPARLEQRIGRVQRLGQEKEVVIFNFVMKDTIDESVYAKIVKKYNLLKEKFGASEDVFGSSELIEKIETGTLGDVETASDIFLEAIESRKDVDEVREYFEERLAKREEEIETLRETMNDELEQFDSRIKALLSGENPDLDEVEEDIEDLQDSYKSSLKEYLRRYTVTRDIRQEFNDGEVILRGSEELLGDHVVRYALDGETALFKDIELLTPENAPLNDMIETTSIPFAVSSVQDDGGIIFDFLISIDSPISTRQEVRRIKVSDSVTPVSRDYESGKSADVAVEFSEVMEALQEALAKVKSEIQTELDDIQEELQVYISREKSRVYEERNDEIERRLDESVREPIRLAEDRVESMKKQHEDGEVTVKEVRDAKKSLKTLENKKRQKIQEIRNEVREVYQEKIDAVESKEDELKSSISLVSCLILDDEV